MPKGHIYLDNHATTPVDPRVLDLMLPYFRECFGNPSSSSHAFGWEAERAVKRARAQVATLIGARSPREIVFTSGATESNGLALRGFMEARAGGFDLTGLHLITSAIEHPSVLQSCELLESMGAEVTRVGVSSEGLVSLAEVEEAIGPKTVLISIMAVNNEVGTIQPIKQLGALARRHGVAFHCDAAQAAGRIEIDVERDQIDMLSLSAHKLYGPKGVGVLYLRRRPQKIELARQQVGGGQEYGLRAGTLNVPAIVGLGAAAELAREERVEESRRLRRLRNRFVIEIDRKVSHYKLHGSFDKRVAGNLSLTFEGVPGEALISALPALAFSVGSACSSAKAAPSHVLSAMGISAQQIRGTIRLGFGRFTTEDEVIQAAKEIAEAVNRLRPGFGYYPRSVVRWPRAA
jgi:cysteine desulfurase